MTDPAPLREAIAHIEKRLTQPGAFRLDDEQRIRAILAALPTDAVQPVGGVDREGYAALADLHTIKGWLHGLGSHPDLTETVADGGVTAYDVYQQDAREFAGRIGRFIDSYATAPQPQPVGGVDREAIARVIDPAAFLFTPEELGVKDYRHLAREAYRAADAILALYATAPTAGSGCIHGISLRGQQGEPAGTMTVIAHMSDGREVVLIEDNGNVISHWKNLRDLTTAGSGWLPIESAPKDGTAILCFYADRHGSDRHSIRYWASGDWPSSGRKEGWCDQYRQLRSTDPTHWMPLPAAPTVGGE